MKVDDEEELRTEIGLQLISSLFARAVEAKEEREEQTAGQARRVRASCSEVRGRGRGGGGEREGGREVKWVGTREKGRREDGGGRGSCRARGKEEDKRA